MPAVLPGSVPQEVASADLSPDWQIALKVLEGGLRLQGESQSMIAKVLAISVEVWAKNGRKPNAMNTVQQRLTMLRAPGIDRSDLSASDQALQLRDLTKRLAAMRRDRLALVQERVMARLARREAAASALLAQRPNPPTGMLARFKHAGYLKAYERWATPFTVVQDRYKQAKALNDQVQGAAKPHRVEAWALVQVQGRDPGLVDRVQAYRQDLAKEAFQERENRSLADQVVRQVEKAVSGRKVKAFGWGDSSERWQAIPESLRKAIDDLIGQPESVQKQELEQLHQQLRKDPERARRLEQVLARGRQFGRGR